MNPTAEITDSLADLQTNLVIKEGKELYTVGNARASKDYCISDMTIQVTITHTCLQNVKIQIFGPGPSTFPSRQQDKEALVTPDAEVKWSNDEGLGAGEKRVNPSAPSSRSFPVTLFEIPFPLGTQCTSGQRTLKFSSSASQSLSSVFTPTDGEVQPLDPLSVFYRLPANGGWTLMVSDGRVYSNSGTLNSWDIKFKLQRCVPTYTWKHLSKSVTGTPPSARYQHSAIVYQNSMYIFGGKNQVQFEDLYRFDYVPDSSSSKWVKLNAFPYDKRHFGHSFVLTPYHLLSIGGGLQGREFRDRLSHVEIRQQKVHTPKQGWRKLPLDGEKTTEAKMLSFEGIPLKSHLMHHQKQGFGKLPSARYFASAAFFQPSTDENRSPQIFLFGGQDETTYFEDLWRIDLALLSQENPDAEIAQLRKRVCDWRISNSAFQTMWLNSCGATPTIASSGSLTMCKLDMILLYSWCEKAYQTIQNL
jgi:subtilisin-like proprotein convertase family protein